MYTFVTQSASDISKIRTHFNSTSSPSPQTGTYDCPLSSKLCRISALTLSICCGFIGIHWPEFSKICAKMSSTCQQVPPEFSFPLLPPNWFWSYSLFPSISLLWWFYHHPKRVNIWVRNWFILFIQCNLIIVTPSPPNSFKIACLKALEDVDILSWFSLVSHYPDLIFTHHIIWFA